MGAVAQVLPRWEAIGGPAVPRCPARGRDVETLSGVVRPLTCRFPSVLLLLPLAAPVSAGPLGLRGRLCPPPCWVGVCAPVALPPAAAGQLPSLPKARPLAGPGTRPPADPGWVTCGDGGEGCRCASRFAGSLCRGCGHAPCPGPAELHPHPRPGSGSRQQGMARRHHLLLRERGGPLGQVGQVPGLAGRFPCTFPTGPPGGPCAGGPGAGAPRGQSVPAPVTRRPPLDAGVLLPWAGGTSGHPQGQAGGQAGALGGPCWSPVCVHAL